MSVFVALEPVTQGTPAGVIHHAAGAVLHDWFKFSAPVRAALLNHGSVGEVQLQSPDDDDAATPPVPDDTGEMPVDLPPDPSSYPEPPLEELPSPEPEPEPDLSDSEPVAPVDVDILAPVPELPAHPMEELPHSAVPAGSEPVTCPRCPGMTFQNRRSLGQHIRRKHPK